MLPHSCEALRRASSLSTESSMLIKVKVTADAPAEKVVKYCDDLYLISVREKAERGEANI